MRIIFIHTSDLRILRGSEKWLLEVCNRLQSRSFDVRIECFPSQLGKYVVNKDDLEVRSKIVEHSVRKIRVRLHRWVSLRIPFNGRVGRTLVRNFQFIPISFALVKSMRMGDAVYFVSSSDNPARLLSLLILSLFLQRRGLIVGMHVRMMISSYQIPLLRFFSRVGILAAVHTVNQKDADYYRNILRCKCVYIPNGVDSKKFSTTRKSDEFTILFVGAFTAAKGADLLPQIYDRLRRYQWWSSSKFLLVSPGGDLAESIKNWSLKEKSVIIKGFVNEKELISLYGESSVVVIPSRIEPFGFVALEAQASGTPVVTSDATGFKLTVLDGQTGYLVENNDPEEFANRIAFLHEIWQSSGPTYKDMCLRAREQVQSNYSWDPIIDRLIRLLHERP